MKKRWLILMLCLLLCVLSACADEPADTADTTAQPTPKIEEITEEVALAPVTVNGQEVRPEIETFAPEDVFSDPGTLRDELMKLPQLRSVTLIRSVPDSGLAAWIGGWDALEAAFRQVAFTYRDLYHGEDAANVTDFCAGACPGMPEEEIGTVLKVFPNLRTLDLSSVEASRAAAAYAVSLAPEITVLWNDEAFGPSDSTSGSVVLNAAADEQTVAAYLACFPQLAEADLRACGLDVQAGDALMKAFPSVAFRRTVTLNGETLDSYTEELDLSGAQIADYETFAGELGRFARLKKLEMHFCSLSDEQLAALRERYPETKIVWTVQIRQWKIRTDAVAFSTMQLSNNTNRIPSEEAQVLQYCTDLVALDLGHNHISDLTWLLPLQKLQVLILAQNHVTDITPIGSLHKLKYIELFMNDIEDISPLGELEDLLDVNLCLTKVTDITPLLRCTKLERIWLGRDVTAQIGETGVATLKNAFPEAQFDLESRASTYNGWREHPRYDAYITMFRTNTAVPPFVPED